MTRHVDRRAFLATGMAAVAGSAVGCSSPEQIPGPGVSGPTGYRARFPRLEGEVFMNAAGGMPLSDFSEAGLARYMDFIRLGPGDGRAEYFGEMWSSVRGLFADLVGARPEEISLVHCTKEGEQLVMDGLDGIRTGGNIVTNDFHFSGSLHNLYGMQKAGYDVRIVKSDGRDLPLQAMLDAIDADTALVSVTLLSNVNGRVEPIEALADAVHAVGGYLYADIIQAAGIYPLDMEAMGIDFAACSCYKWLHGVHGTGFLYVREGLAETALRHDRFPGGARHNYRPWVAEPDPAHGDFLYRPPTDGRRFEPGHPCYLGYAAVYEGMQFVQREGVASLLEHSAGLSRQLVEQLDPDRYECTSPNVGSAPIVAFRFREPIDLEPRLVENGIVISLGRGSMRISPGLFNTEEDVEHVVSVLNA